MEKQINYLGRDFGELKQSLISFAKTYFPDTFNDFNESDPGMMFIEMASYVGDVLSLYIDNYLNESLITTANERKNIYALAEMFGYKVKLAHSAHTEIDVYQQVPAKGSGVNNEPDLDYAQVIDRGMEIQSKSNPNVIFRTNDIVDFTFSSSFDPIDIQIYATDEITGEPSYYLLKKQVQVSSGKVKEKTFQFTNPKPYDKIQLQDSNIIGIESIYDSDNDRWYEVDNLAQQYVTEGIRNSIGSFSTSTVSNNNDAPYILSLKKVSKRFKTRVLDDNTLEIQFGSGLTEGIDEELIPSPKNVGLSFTNPDINLNSAIDPSNFMYTKTYGLAPANTTLTVKYLVGNGVIDNVSSEDLTIVKNIKYINNGVNSSVNQNLLSFVRNSIRCINPVRASGGRLRLPIEELRQNIMASNSEQSRIVTTNDFVIRSYSMPGKYGNIAKAFVKQDTQLNNRRKLPNEIDNPLAVNLYVLSYDNNTNLISTNNTVKSNLKTYLHNFRMLTDAINIRDAYIINIGLDFEIVTFPNFNSNDVIVRCINELRSYFNITKWSINQPIIISKIYSLLDKVSGVQTVKGIEFKNLCGGNYSPHKYDIIRATKNGVIYPAKDPAIFEIKFPNSDIKGRVVNI